MATGQIKHEHETHKGEMQESPSLASEQKLTFLACLLGTVASIGGFMFGYVSGQISGFFLMDDYARRFGEEQADGTFTFSAVRQGTIVGMLSAGCFIGALSSGMLADAVGRKLAISITALFACVGNIIEISSETVWAQYAVGRGITGISIGSLCAVVPMYQSESSPVLIRGVLISVYQLFITLGIWTAEMVNWGTESKSNSASWRIPNGIGFLWALILGVGILFLPESPRYAYRRGRVDEARNTIAKFGGVDSFSPSVNQEIADIQTKLDEEKSAADVRWHDIFTADRMLYRTLLGIFIQAASQLTGANYFFYYGTTAFEATGISNSYVTQLILGSVNVFCTVCGLWVVHKVGRRTALMAGAGWMMMCFFVYSFVGHFTLDQENPMNTPEAGAVLIAFSCLAIAAFATTWGPLSWAAVAELFPSQYRARCMALATAGNWACNFFISFFTRFITDEIDYLYGLVFAGCCAAIVVIVFFFFIESKGRSLEEIDTMYVTRVNPIKSANWKPERPHKGETPAETPMKGSDDNEGPGV